MIPLNTYQRARLDVLRVFCRYHTLPNAELKESSFQDDIDTIFKKWGYVEEVRDAKKYLKKSLNKCKDTSDPAILEFYRDCIDDMLNSLAISEQIERSERNKEFCKKIKKAQDRYYRKSNNNNLLEYDF